jgi:hypothetical protein
VSLFVPSLEIEGRNAGEADNWARHKRPSTLNDTYRCPRVAKKLHNLFVIKDINFFFLLDDSYVSTAYSENIAVYIQVSQYYKNTKVMFF